MAEKPKTLTELIEEAETIDTPLIALALSIATAKAVQELWEHQHQILHKWEDNNLTIGETTSKPIGYGSTR